jgi:hypothetical protein
VNTVGFVKLCAILCASLLVVAEAAHAQVESDSTDAAIIKRFKSLPIDAQRQTIETITGIPVNPEITSEQAADVFSKIKPSDIPNWKNPAIEQIVDPNSPAPAVCLDCPSGVKTASCQAPLKKSEDVASQFAMHFGTDLAAVALLEVKYPGDTDFSPIATAFAITQGWIVTNYHVVAAFTDGKFPRNHIKSGIQVALLFNHALGTTGGDMTIGIPAETVVFGSPDPDVVAMKVPASSVVADPPQPSASDDALRLNDEIAIVGFPQRNGDDPTSTYEKVFGLCDNSEPPVTMRIAVGTVATLTPKLDYAINTLASNSGSPIYRVSDGLLVGVHSGYGGNSQVNDGVPLGQVKSVLAMASGSGAGIQ